MRGINDDEVVDFVKFTETRNIDIRFIEYMPFGGNNFSSKKMVPFKEMLSKIGQTFDNQVIRLKDKPNDTSKVRFNQLKSLNCVFLGIQNSRL
jgi:cyclic pyranopterin phosphate synthase